MVKLTGPALSTAASGKLAGALIFSSNKGRAYVKKQAKPKQPRSYTQISMRAMMRFLSEEWKAFSSIIKATWLPIATDRQVNPFNAYQGYNLTRWRNFTWPTQAYPANESMLQGYNPVIDAAGDVRHVQLQFAYSQLPRDNWGGMLFHRTIGYPAPLFETMIHIVHLTGPGTVYWDHGPLTAGTQYYAMIMFSKDGLCVPTQIDTVSAIVT